MWAILDRMGYEYVYEHEDFTLVHHGPLLDTDASIFTYFNDDRELVRVNLLLDEENELDNVNRFFRVRDTLLETYTGYDRIVSDEERELPDRELIDMAEIARRVRQDGLEICTTWYHVDADGNRTQLEIRLQQLSD
ncbi:hypothetical protein ACFL6T_07375, partial [Candidatus Zixiibacteriota bacterium]